MEVFLCPDIVGRQEELATLEGDLDAARNGAGKAVLLVGEAGVGKTRVTREMEALAHDWGMRVLRGRAADAPQEPYRAIAEALLSGVRSAPPGVSPDLGPFRPILGRLIPEWRSELGQDSASGEESSVALGEAILRLLHALARPSPGHQTGGLLLILEDLHWADTDTLRVMEYVIDNLATVPVLLLATFRSEEQSHGLRAAHGIAARRAARLIDVRRLDRTVIERMASLCLGTSDEEGSLPDPAIDLLGTYSEGLPFLIEELLAAWVDAGALERAPGGWRIARDLAPLAPVTFADTVNRRLERLGPDTARVLEMAALLGHHFDWRLLGPAAALQEGDVLEGLRAARSAHIVVEAPGNTPVAEFSFRHALTRTAILDRLLPPERAALSERLLRTMEAAHDNLPEEWLDLAASLAETAGEQGRAAELLLESGRRSIDRGALAGAAAAVDRASRLAAERSFVWVEAMESLMAALVLAGEWERVFAAGKQLLRHLERHEEDTQRPARVFLRMGRAALTAGHWGDAREYLQAAHHLLSSEETPALLARHDALRAQLAVERARLDEAAAYARSALERAERTAQPDVACEALEVLGRCARVRDFESASSYFERALSIAEGNGLTVWRIRALHELGTLDIFGSCRLDRLLEARALAGEAGALATAAMLDIQIAAAHDNRGEFEEELAVALRSRSLAQRLRLTMTEATALLFQATAYAHQSRKDEMETALAEALRLAGAEPDILAGVHESRAFLALTEENRGRALQEVEAAMAAIEALPATTPGPYRGLWALLRAVEGGDSRTACDAVRRSGATILPINRAYLDMAEAIALGQSGQGKEAAYLVARADADLAGHDWFRFVGLRLVAEAALRDGWGDPETWLLGAYSYFEDHGYDRVARACASLLRRAGAPVVPVGRTYNGVPAGLRSLGITRREMDVFTLLAEGLSNREIAERLYLSPRTVEKHVGSLLAKTGARTRAQLAALAVSSAADTR